MTEEQKELVVLAAKAMGYDSRFGFNTCKVSKGTYGEWVDWNPMTSDADCFRMETELEIDIEWVYKDGKLIGCKAIHKKYFYVHYIEYLCSSLTCKYSARHLSSTRVAAEIQRRKESKG